MLITRGLGISEGIVEVIEVDKILLNIEDKEQIELQLIDDEIVWEVILEEADVVEITVED